MKEAKYYDCKTCTEMTWYESNMICSLRVKEITEGLPPISSLCSGIKECEFYREIK